MIQVYRYNEEGYLVEPVLLSAGSSIPEDCTEIKPSNKLYSPKYVNGEWVNGISDEELLKKKKEHEQLVEANEIKVARTVNILNDVDVLGETTTLNMVDNITLADTVVHLMTEIMNLKAELDVLKNG